MQVRAMRVEDLSAIAQLSAELGYPVEAPDLRSRFEALERDQSGALLVAEVSPGQIAGWVHVSGEWTLTNGALAEIRGLVVARGQRRKGAGRKLIAGARAIGASVSGRGSLDRMPISSIALADTSSRRHSTYFLGS